MTGTLKIMARKMAMDPMERVTEKRFQVLEGYPKISLPNA